MNAVSYKITNIPSGYIKKCKYFDKYNFQCYSIKQDFVNWINNLSIDNLESSELQMINTLPNDLTVFKITKPIKNHSDNEKFIIPKEVSEVWNEILAIGNDIYSVLQTVYLKEIVDIFAFSGIEKNKSFKIYFRGYLYKGFYNTLSKDKKNVKNIKTDVDSIFKNKDNPLIKLVLEGISISLSLNSLPMRFLNLMIVLDSLLGIGNSTNYVVPRNCAVLLSSNKECGNQIFDDIKRLIGIRSAVVHHGNYKKASLKDVEIVAEYIRACIIKLIQLKKLKKNDIIKVLSSEGYGILSSQELSSNKEN